MSPLGVSAVWAARSLILQPAAGSAGEPDQDLEFLAGELALALERRADRSVQP